MLKPFQLANLKNKADIFRNKWQESYLNFYKKEPVYSQVKHLSKLDEMNMFSNEIVILYDTKTLKIEFVSKAVENILHYSQEEFTHANKLLELDPFQPEYQNDMIKWFDAFSELESKLMDEDQRKIFTVLGGKCYLDKNGDPVKFTIRKMFNRQSFKELPAYSLIVLTESDHLFKNFEYWIYFQSSNLDKNISQMYRQSGIENHFLTKRENEILQLIANGKSSKEVAAELFISSETVSQHRKNMIKRVNAKDTTSLIQLCKLCRIF